MAYKTKSECIQAVKICKLTSHNRLRCCEKCPYNELRQQHSSIRTGIFCHNALIEDVKEYLSFLPKEKVLPKHHSVEDCLIAIPICHTNNSTEFYCELCPYFKYTVYSPSPNRTETDCDKILWKDIYAHLRASVNQAKEESI